MSIEKDLSHTGSVFFDTAPIIYYIEGHDTYGPLMKQITQYLYKNAVFTFTSVITIAEVLPKPVSQNQLELIEKFLRFLKDGTKINVLILRNYGAITDSRPYRIIAIFKNVGAYMRSLCPPFYNFFLKKKLELLSSMHWNSSF